MKRIKKNKSISLTEKEHEIIDLLAKAMVERAIQDEELSIRHKRVKHRK